MAKRGPKPIPDAKRAHTVVRFKESELNAIKKVSKEHGKPISVFIRDVLLNHFESEGIPTELTIDDPNQLKIDTD